jgi:hypothetical protein
VPLGSSSKRAGFDLLPLVVSISSPVESMAIKPGAPVLNTRKSYTGASRHPLFSMQAEGLTAMVK